MKQKLHETWRHDAAYVAVFRNFLKIMKYFTLQELTKTSVQGINNTPGIEQEQNLRNLVENLLDPIREKWKAPILVNSGFRSSAVNKAVGGAANSQHLTGEAADITLPYKPDNGLLFGVIKDSGLTYDQLIWEKGNDRYPQWIHVSLKRNGNNRKQVLRIR